MTLPDRIKAVRQREGLSQKEMALSLNIALSTFQYYERGERTPPADFLINMVSAYGVRPDWLLMGTGEMPSAEDKLPFNSAFLKELAEALDMIIEQERVSLSPGKKSDLLVLLYETLIKEETLHAGNARKQFINENVNKFLKLLS